MDYIREELLRQRAVLAQLLLGRTVEAEQEEERAAEAEETVWEGAVEMAELETFRASRALAAGETFRQNGRGVRVEDSDFWEVSDTPAERLPEAALRRVFREDRLWRSNRLPGGTEPVSGAEYALSGRTAAGMRQGRVQTSQTYQNEIFRTVEEAATAAAETADARELSRVFQRDARRYDGGFTLY